MCVCNATYCDDLPPLKKPIAGMATVFESSKTGDRFKETQLKISTKPIHSEAGVKSVIITIDSKQKYQSINGFGGAFTDASGVMLKSVNNSLAELLLESYFGPNGIEYSMARIPIGATDYSVRPYTYDDVDGDLELKHFALEMEDLEWKVSYYQTFVTKDNKLF